MNATALTPTVHPHPEPTRWSAAVFLAKAKVHQLRRGVRNWREGIQKHPRSNELASLPVVAQWQSDLRRGDYVAPREKELQEGKVQNLRVAAAALHGI